MKRIILAVLALFLMAVCAQAVVDEGPNIVTFPGKGKLGSVSFDHLAHHERGAECVLCHHTGVNEGNCADCHGYDPEAPHIQDALHLLCIGCHKYKSGPTECEECHVN